MSEKLDDYIENTLNSITANTVVGLIDELSLKGNPLIHEERARGRRSPRILEVAQNFSYLDVIGYKSYYLTLITGRQLNSEGELDDTKYAELWIDEYEGKGYEYLIFERDLDNNFTETHKGLKSRGIRIIRILEACELLDDIKPDEIQGWTAANTYRRFAE